VHLDDALEPFYTIQLPDGREKQTDDAHLSEFIETKEAKDIANMLIGLDSAQLIKVVEFVRGLTNSNQTVQPTPSMPVSVAPFAPPMAPPMSAPAPVAIPQVPDMPPPEPPLSPPATVPAPVHMGQMTAPAPEGMMSMPAGMQ
jgi:hypothetical protein